MAQTKPRTRLLLADDESHFHQALSLWLETKLNIAPEFEIVGVVTHAERLWERVETTQPDILLLDWALPGLRSEAERGRLIQRLRKSFPRLHIIATSSVPGMRRQILAAGAHDYISKTEPPDHLLDALQKHLSIR